MGAVLKAVPDNPPARKPRAVKPKSPVKTAAGSSYRQLLEALRDNIAEQIDEGVPPRDLASLSRRLLEISKELDGLKSEEEGDDVGNAADTPDEQWPTSPG